MDKLNSDALGKMSDNEVDFLMKKIKSEIQKLYEKNKKNKDSNIRQWLFDAQIEYCYIKREHEGRLARSIAHNEYINNKRSSGEQIFVN